MTKEQGTVGRTNWWKSGQIGPESWQKTAGEPHCDGVDRWTWRYSSNSSSWRQCTDKHCWGTYSIKATIYLLCPLPKSSCSVCSSQKVHQPYFQSNWSSQPIWSRHLPKKPPASTSSSLRKEMAPSASLTQAPHCCHINEAPKLPKQPQSGKAGQKSCEPFLSPAFKRNLSVCTVPYVPNFLRVCSHSGCMSYTFRSTKSYFC